MIDMKTKWLMGGEKGEEKVKDREGGKQE